MKESSLRLPDAELDVMLVLWEQNSPMTSNQIMARLQGKKSWGLTTLLNFLARLSDRGFIRCDKEGRVNHYTVLIEWQDYLAQASRDFLSKLYGGSIRNMVSFLYRSQAIGDHDLVEIRRFIDEKEKEKGDMPHWLL
jgi:predicted transcriptional regulator